MSRSRDLADSTPGIGTGQPLLRYSSYLANYPGAYYGPINGWYYSPAVTVTLPSGMFTATPMITATVYQSGNICNVSLNSISSSSFTYWHQQNGGYSYGGWVMYTAVQQS